MKTRTLSLTILTAALLAPGLAPRAEADPATCHFAASVTCPGVEDGKVAFFGFTGAASEACDSQAARDAFLAHVERSGWVPKVCAETPAVGAVEVLGAPSRKKAASIAGELLEACAREVGEARCVQLKAF